MLINAGEGIVSKITNAAVIKQKYLFDMFLGTGRFYLYLLKSLTRYHIYKKKMFFFLSV